MTDEQEATAPPPAELPEAQEEVPAPVDGEPGAAAEDAAAQAADDDASLAEVHPRCVLQTCFCSRTWGGRSRTLLACFSAALARA